MTYIWAIVFRSTKIDNNSVDLINFAALCRPTKAGYGGVSVNEYVDWFYLFQKNFYAF